MDGRTLKSRRYGFGLTVPSSVSETLPKQSQWYRGGGSSSAHSLLPVLLVIWCLNTSPATCSPLTAASPSQTLDSVGQSMHQASRLVYIRPKARTTPSTEAVTTTATHEIIPEIFDSTTEPVHFPESRLPANLRKNGTSIFGILEREDVIPAKFLRREKCTPRIKKLKVKYCGGKKKTTIEIAECKGRCASSTHALALPADHNTGRISLTDMFESHCKCCTPTPHTSTMTFYCDDGSPSQVTVTEARSCACTFNCNRPTL